MELKYIFISLVFLFIASAVYGQTGGITGSNAAGEEIRPDKYLTSVYHLNSVSATDHLPLFLSHPLDHWSAPKVKFLINNLEFRQFPMNMNSPNLLPFDFPGLSGSRYTGTPSLLFNSAPAGYLNFYEEEPADSFTAEIRAYIGSETGDPLIHVFTKKNLEQVNKNKIPLSGSLSFSDSFTGGGYRFTLGYYGSYSTGSVNDPIISARDEYYYSKQNKQVLGTLRITAGEYYTFSVSGISYYGWDIPPFISSFVHFESFLYRIYAAARYGSGLSLILSSDISSTEIQGGSGTLPSKFDLSEYRISAEQIFDTEEFIFHAAADIAYNKAVNFKVSGISQNFFNDDADGIIGGLQLSSSFSPGDFHLTAAGRIDYHFTNASLSGQLQLNYEPVSPSFGINISSTAASPNLTELYGSFFLVNKDDPAQDTFMISGNRNLLAERINHIGVSYTSGKNEGGFQQEIEVFAENIENQLRQRTIDAVRKGSGEILREAEYFNSPDKKTFGGRAKLFFSNDLLETTVSWIFTDNSEILYFPRHSVFSGFSYNLPINSTAEIKISYNSKTEWEEFAVKPENDFYGKNFPDKLGENLSFDFGYHQKFSEFYFFSKLILSLTVRNFFNNKLRYLPAGNYLERTVIFSVFSRI